MIFYEQIDYDGNYVKRRDFIDYSQIKEEQKKTYSGELKVGTKKRMSKAIDLMVQSVVKQKIYCPMQQKEFTHKLSFITLTVSKKENITARECYDEVFKHFLQWMRRTAKVSTYIWKCEMQKRGQIHYHITTPTWIHWQHIRDKWNNLQRAAGYLVEFEKEFKHSNPNSTDVHEVRKVSNLSGYLVKEFCKTIQNPKTVGKVWDCSQNLKKYKYFKVIESIQLRDALKDLNRKKKLSFERLEQCVVIKLNKTDISQIINLKHFQDYKQFIQEIRKYRQKEVTKIICYKDKK